MCPFFRLPLRDVSANCRTTHHGFAQQPVVDGKMKLFGCLPSPWFALDRATFVRLITLEQLLMQADHSLIDVVHTLVKSNATTTVALRYFSRCELVASP